MMIVSIWFPIGHTETADHHSNTSLATADWTCDHVSTPCSSIKDSTHPPLPPPIHPSIPPPGSGRPDFPTQIKLIFIILVPVDLNQYADWVVVDRQQRNEATTVWKGLIKIDSPDSRPRCFPTWGPALSAWSCPGSGFCRTPGARRGARTPGRRS